MAELSEQEFNYVADIFCRSYNKINQSAFKFAGKEHKQNEVDFYISDGEQTIGIQHSAIEDLPNWFKSTKQVCNIITRLEEVGNNFGLKCHLYIYFNKNIPTKEKDVESFVKELILFLVQHIKEETFELRFQKMNDLPNLTKIFNYLSEFKVLSIPTENFSVCFGHQDWGYGERDIEEYADYIVSKMIDKQKDYGSCSEVILLFVMEPSGVDEGDLRCIEKRLREYDKQQDMKFKEFWLASTANDGYCERVFPSQ